MLLQLASVACHPHSVLDNGHVITLEGHLHCTLQFRKSWYITDIAEKRNHNLNKWRRRRYKQQISMHMMGVCVNTQFGHGVASQGQRTTKQLCYEMQNLRNVPGYKMTNGASEAKSMDKLNMLCRCAQPRDGTFAETSMTHRL